jgi:WD40 repeat protein
LGTPFPSQSGVCDAAFGPATDRGDPTVVAAYRDGGIVRWDAKTGRVLTTFETPRQLPHFLDIAVTSEGGRFVTADTLDAGMLRFWDLASGEPVAPPVLLPDKAGAIAINPGGRLAFAGYSQSKGQFYSTETGKPIGPELQGLVFPPTAVKFSHDGKVLATVGQAGVKLWNVP